LAIGASTAALLREYEAAIHWAGAVVLVGVAVWGLCRLRALAPAPPPPTGRPAARVFTRFVALTLINPLTAVYFAWETAYAQLLTATLGPPGAAAA